MSPVPSQRVDIDIGEDFLDVSLHPAGKVERLPRGEEGTPFLIAPPRESRIERVVLESPGGLRRRLVRALQEARHSVRVVNPERIWAYRRLVGRVAKTDRIDARLFAEYAATMRPAESLPPSEDQQAMKEPSGRRRQLIEAIAAEKKRLRRAGQEAARSSLESQIAILENEVKRIESAIELPELGRLNAKRIASLVGVVPHSNESGKNRSKAIIRGGRPRARTRLHASEFNARRYNPGDRRFQRAAGGAWQDVQASDDGVHAETRSGRRLVPGARPIVVSRTSRRGGNRGSRDRTGLGDGRPSSVHPR